MTIEDRIREIALAPVKEVDFQENTDQYFYELCIKAFNLGIEIAAEEAETTYDSAYNVIVDRGLILKLKI